MNYLAGLLFGKHRDPEAMRCGVLTAFQQARDLHGRAIYEYRVWCISTSDFSAFKVDQSEHYAFAAPLVDAIPYSDYSFWDRSINRGFMDAKLTEPVPNPLLAQLAGFTPEEDLVDDILLDLMQKCAVNLGAKHIGAPQ